MPSEEQLSAVLSEFARTILTDFPIQGILEHLVLRIVEIMPITAAGVTLISPHTKPRFVAASDEAALRYEQLQAELGDGPCLAAYRTGEAAAGRISWRMARPTPAHSMPRRPIILGFPHESLRRQTRCQ